MNELLSMRAFVKVVETGSFAEAARQIGIAKSVITRRVNQLEEHLQLELIQRSTRNLDITDTGLNYYQRCVHLLADLEDAKAVVSSIDQGVTGSLRISCVSSFASAYLTDDACDFLVDHPNLNLDMRVHERFCDPVLEGIDLTLDVTELKKEIYEKVDIVAMKCLLVANAEYLKKYGAPEQPDDIKDHRIVNNDHLDPENRIIFIKDKTVKNVIYDPVMLTNNIWMLRSAVAKGSCMAVIPAFFIEKELISGDFITVLPDFLIQYPTLSGYYRRTPFVPMKITMMLKFLKEKYGDIPPWEKRLLDKRPELSKALAHLN